VKTLAFALVAAFALVGAALAASQKDTYSLSATLKGRSEVPKPVGVPAGATGRFTGKAVELENDRAQITWRLTFSKLSGRAVAAHIHVGRAGKAGPVVAGLCGPCRNGQRGTVSVSHAQLKAIEAGRAYVNIHTAKNQAGEIRGQLKATETGSSSNSSPPPPPSPTPPPPPNPYP
jgi:hypothetical protein